MAHAIDISVGRSLNQCNATYDEMMRSVRPAGLMRSTSGRESGPATGVKRPFVPEAAASYRGRVIQPRPEGAPFTSTSDPAEPPKKKRGRPTKAEAEERRQAALARGEPYPPPRRASVLTALAAPSSLSSVPEAPGTALPPRPAPTRPPSVAAAAAQAALGVASRGLQTPPPPSLEQPSSESSSGRRRRGRPAGPEEEARRAQESAVTIRGPAACSRYPDILSREEPS